MLSIITSKAHAQVWLNTYDVCTTSKDYALLFYTGGSMQQLTATQHIIANNLTNKVLSNYDGLQLYTQVKIEALRVECKRQIALANEQELLHSDYVIIPATNKLQDVTL